MSKRKSTGAKNTLFNYFTSPSVSSNNTKRNRVNLEEDTTPKKTKEKRLVENDSDDENIQPTKRSKRIIVQASDGESDDCNTSLIDTSNEQNKIKDKLNESSKNVDNSEDKPLLKLTGSVSVNIEDEDTTWLHNRLDFLKPNNIKDINGNRPSHACYDGRTLLVPNQFLAKQTPAMRQWWVMKSRHFDCVLFFKVGKFYELYHMDAVIGVNDLGFSFMKGEFAHSGFPESAYGRFSTSLVELGYKVARVEQTETPDMMAERCRLKGGGKLDKVVRREICQITNKATQVQAIQDLELKQPLPEYLLAIAENHQGNHLEFGVCFIDTSIGIFHIGQFKDDCQRSKLLTLLAENPPAVILQERKNLSTDTKKVLKTLGNVTQEILTSEIEFYSTTKTLTELLEGDYFKDKKEQKAALPDIIKNMLNENDSLGRTCKLEYELAVRCLGACMWYLKKCLLDVQLLSIGKFEYYYPATEGHLIKKQFMILDSTTLYNLHIIGPTGTLQSTLDYCCTAFGKRLLKMMICRPLCDANAIIRRQEGISELLCEPDIVRSAREFLISLPDLERQLARIHTMGNAQRASTHPDSRAIFYEEKTYTKRKIQNFMSTLNGFEKTISIVNLFTGVKSSLLKECTGVYPEGLFPDLSNTITFFKNSFDHNEAEKEGKIIPQPGMDDEYDDIIKEINDIKRRSEHYLKSQKTFFGCEVTYYGNDKKRFQLDIPEHASKKVTREYSLEGAKKGAKPSKRYHTEETREILSEMLAAEKKCVEVLKDLNRRIFEKFSKKFDDWMKACECLAMLDCIISLVEYTKNQSSEMCVPSILPVDSDPTFIVKNGVHPCVPNIESFVPNDTELGTAENPPLLVLTGPNMGGKSTLMRQIALIAILAQMGCHIPASNLAMTLVDRIFTRLGAKDDIMAGHSTFLVELQEASIILRHASPNSLVLLDELGRGTSTYDGTAIATAYVERLTIMKCRTIFSTHYYCLLDHFRKHPAIQLGHMACKVESDEDDITQETVTFMYKMAAGACPKSYGFNAARLAGISRSITSRANQISQKMEAETLSRKLFRKIFCHGDNNIQDVIASITV